MMAEIRVAHTAELDAALLAAVRQLLEDAFAGDFSEHDWQHALGGVHALAYADGSLVGHGSVVERTLTYDGRPLRTGYVEGMAVRADRRREGHGAAIMDALEHVIRDRFELGALASTEQALPFYAARGWVRWRGHTVPDGEAAVHVLPTSVAIDPAGELACDLRAGDLW
jgi:aminoglycoside 2'-N-acetyltransferase I